MTKQISTKLPKLSALIAVLCMIIYTVITNSCNISNTSEVVVYVSVDQPFAEPILNLFSKRTGIKVKPVFDVEAAKTVGLVNRIRAEKKTQNAMYFGIQNLLTP